MLLATRNLAVMRGASFLAFPDITLERNELLLLRGPSGSGKTTLLSMIAGLLTPSQGQVIISGQDLYAMKNAQRDNLRGRSLGFVFQNFHLLPSLSVRANILLAAKMAGMPEDTQRMERLLDRLGLSAVAQRRPHEISHGERQRTAIARAVFNRPAILIADEPTSALDDKNAQATIDLLKSQASETGAALLLATHDSRIAAGFGRVIHLDGNRAVAA